MEKSFIYNACGWNSLFYRIRSSLYIYERYNLLRALASSDQMEQLYFIRIYVLKDVAIKAFKMLAEFVQYMKSKKNLINK
jgi:hypothetical protein